RFKCDWSSDVCSSDLAPGSDVTGHPNAILIFQKLADRNADGAINGSDTPAPNRSGANSQFSWYPINFYDAREGFPRDSTALTGRSEERRVGKALRSER